MRNTLLIPMGAGIVSAALHLSVTLGSPSAFLLAYFAQLPLAAIGLAFGLTQAAVSVAFAAVLVALFSPSVGALSLFIILSALPVLMIVHFALKNRSVENGGVAWYPIGGVLVWLSLLGILTFLVAYVIFMQGDGGVRGAIDDYLRSITDNLAQSDRAAVDAMTASMAYVFPSIASASWIMMNIINVVLAQRFVAASNRNIRPRPVYSEIETPIWPIGICLLGGIFAFFDGELGFLGFNIMLIAGIPFFFIGLAVLHNISSAWRGRFIWLIGIYLFLTLALWPALVIAALGVLEFWLRLRDRAKARRTNKGNK